MGANEVTATGHAPPRVDCTGLNAPQLRAILHKRKITNTGYTKWDLVGLAEQYNELCDELEDDDSHDVSFKGRRVNADGQNILLPDPSKLKSWTPDLKVLPTLQSHQVIAYAGMEICEMYLPKYAQTI